MFRFCSKAFKTALQIHFEPPNPEKKFNNFKVRIFSIAFDTETSNQHRLKNPLAREISGVFLVTTFAYIPSFKVFARN